MSDQKPRWVEMMERVEIASKDLRDNPGVEAWSRWTEIVTHREVLHLIHLVRLAQGGQEMAEKAAAYWQERAGIAEAELFADTSGETDRTREDLKSSPTKDGAAG